MRTYKYKYLKYKNKYLALKYGGSDAKTQKVDTKEYHHKKTYDLIENKKEAIIHIFKQNIIFNFLDKILEDYKKIIDNWNDNFRRREVDITEKKKVLEEIKKEQYLILKKKKIDIKNDFTTFFYTKIKKSRRLTLFFLKGSSELLLKKEFNLLLDYLIHEVSNIIKNITDENKLFNLYKHIDSMSFLLRENEQILDNILSSRSYYLYYNELFAHANKKKLSKEEKKKIYQEYQQYFINQIKTDAQTIPLFATKLIEFYKGDNLIGHVYLNEKIEKIYDTLTFIGIQLSYKQFFNTKRLGLSYLMLYYVSQFALLNKFKYIRVYWSPLGYINNVFKNMIDTIDKNKKEKPYFKVKKNQFSSCDIENKSYECYNIDSKIVNGYANKKLREKGMIVK